MLLTFTSSDNINIRRLPISKYAKTKFWLETFLIEDYLFRVMYVMKIAVLDSIPENFLQFNIVLNSATIIIYYCKFASLATIPLYYLYDGGATFENNFSDVLQDQLWPTLFHNLFRWRVTPQYARNRNNRNNKCNLNRQGSFPD